MQAALDRLALEPHEVPLFQCLEPEIIVEVVAFLVDGVLDLFLVVGRDLVELLADDRVVLAVDVRRFVEQSPVDMRDALSNSHCCYS